ncbi:hypothetical protein CARUB_v10018404mg [Capsella rubella]|uniref:DNA helicase Pif1-like 2B domain-containing protein n=1 Tax=Capsella rubella TaxID=81985 RepID=R0FS01_9BRAS|nr:hypothetical protein CARUB_v10018404mg [Capsella rubella]
MALMREHSSSSSSTPLDASKKIKVQITRTWQGNNTESDNSIDMGTRIHTTIDENEAFSEWISEIGNGRINNPNDRETEVDISEDLLITECNDPIKPIVNQVYGESFAESHNLDFYQEKAILCHTDDVVDQINDYMISLLPGEEQVCYSADSIYTSTPNDDMLYPLEFLNSLNPSGLPGFKLRLKVGAPVMLLRDLNPSEGFCKGTRLQITRLARFVLEARIITGNRRGEKILLPRIPAYPSDADYPTKIKRNQFPLKLAFAMTIDEGQVQTLSKVGLYLPRRVFSNGQMYVAISKVKSSAGLKVLITDKNAATDEETKNVVFKKVF